MLHARINAVLTKYLYNVYCTEAPRHCLLFCAKRGIRFQFLSLSLSLRPVVYVVAWQKLKRIKWIWKEIGDNSVFIGNFGLVANVSEWKPHSQQVTQPHTQPCSKTYLSECGQCIEQCLERRASRTRVKIDEWLNGPLSSGRDVSMWPVAKNQFDIFIWNSFHNRRRRSTHRYVNGCWWPPRRQQSHFRIYSNFSA